MVSLLIPMAMDLSTFILASVYLAQLLLRRVTPTDGSVDMREVLHSAPISRQGLL